MPPYARKVVEDQVKLAQGQALVKVRALGPEKESNLNCSNKWAH
jgi:hypothetical protein